VDVYRRYAECIARTPAGGLAIELGSGAGFARDVIPELVTTDVLPYDGVDRVVDATAMPFADGELRFIGMLNVFHHIPDVAAFLAEAQRCLAPGGRMLIVDQHVGVISKPILRHAHHEPFRPEADRWEFDSSGPLSGANGALAWIVFRRDLTRFRDEFPGLELSGYTPHSPLRYWLAGGLKPWSLLTRRSGRAAAALDRALIRVAPGAGSFVDVEVARRR
jgi:SAM-dependent methyltransferase